MSLEPELLPLDPEVLPPELSELLPLLLVPLPLVGLLVSVPEPWKLEPLPVLLGLFRSEVPPWFELPLVEPLLLGLV